MDRKQATDLARMMALVTEEDHAYLPKTRGEAAKFKPHDWVVDAIMLAHDSNSLDVLVGSADDQA